MQEYNSVARCIIVNVT